MSLEPMSTADEIRVTEDIDARAEQRVRQNLGPGSPTTPQERDAYRRALARADWSPWVPPLPRARPGRRPSPPPPRPDARRRATAHLADWRTR